MRAYPTFFLLFDRNKILLDAAVNTNGLDSFLRVVLSKLLTLPKDPENSNLSNHLLSSLILQSNTNVHLQNRNFHEKKLKTIFSVLNEALKQLEANDPNSLFKKFEDNYDYHLKLMLTIGALITDQSDQPDTQRFQEMISNLSNECNQYFVDLMSLDKSNGSYGQLVKYSNTLHECKTLAIESLMNTKCLNSLKRQLFDNEFDRCLTNSTQTCLRILRALRHETDERCDQKIFDQRFLTQLLDLFQNIVRKQSPNKAVFNSNDIRAEILNIILDHYLDFELTGSGLSVSDSKVILENIIIQLNKEQAEKRAENGKASDEFLVYSKRALLNKVFSSENFR